MKLSKKNIPFTMVANDVLYRDDISLKAKGLFAYLFSKPDGWDFAARRIANECVEEYKAILAGLRELEKAGLLKRQKQGDGRMDYLIEYSDPQPRKNEVSLFDNALANEPTPGEVARSFFDGEDRFGIIKSDFVGRGMPEQTLNTEIRKFLLYWTEPTKSGKKQRWETEKTFDVKRRLFTWLSRSKDFNKSPYAKDGKQIVTATP